MVMHIFSAVVLSYLDAGFDPRCGPKDFWTFCLLLAACCLLLLKRVAHPWTLKGGVKPRHAKPGSVIKTRNRTELGPSLSGSRPTEFPFLHAPPPPPKRCRKWVFSPREPGRALQVSTPPNLGVLNFIMRLILFNQALGHPKMRFSGSRPTEFPFIQLPPKTVLKMGSFTS